MLHQIVCCDSSLYLPDKSPTGPLTWLLGTSYVVNSINIGTNNETRLVDNEILTPLYSEVDASPEMLPCLLSDPWWE